MASLNDVASKVEQKANIIHNHNNMSIFTNPRGIGPSNYNVNAMFKSQGHNGIEFVSSGTNTFGMGGHSDGNFRIWYGDVDDTAQNPDTDKDYIITINKTGTIQAYKVYNAVWNDYAEFYPRGEQTESGDIIQLDTLSKEEKYIKAKKGSTTVVGVHSDTFGHLIGGENPEDGKDYVEHNLDKYIPVGLVGRVNCKILGKIKKGDRVVVSDINGVGRKFNPSTDTPFQIFGMAVEDKDTDTIEKVKINFRGGGF